MKVCTNNSEVSARSFEDLSDPPAVSLADGFSPVRLLFAGGCHVGGFPVGEQLGFPRIAVEQLRRQRPAHAFSVRSLLYVTLASTDRILDACREYAPHVLVLQLGHYESSIPLRKRIKKLMRPSAGSAVSHSSCVSWSADYEPHPELHFTNSWTHQLKNAAKLSLDSVLRVAARPAFDGRRLKFSMASLLHHLRELGVPQVLVLSPFPSLDPTINRYRRQVHSILFAAAKRHSVHFLDVTALSEPAYSLGTPAKAALHLFADDRHLGVEGHRALGLLLAHKIDEVLDMAEMRFQSSSVLTSAPSRRHCPQVGNGR
jgi:hypothetical protein